MASEVSQVKRATFLLAMCGLVLLVSGCVAYRTPVRPPSGGLFTRYKAPLTTQYNQTAVCEKSGSTSSLYVRDIIVTGLDIGWGKADIATAARNGGLQTVKYADYEILAVLGAFGRFTVTVYGE